jgi:hypothetical protein
MRYGFDGRRLGLGWRRHGSGGRLFGLGRRQLFCPKPSKPVFLWRWLRFASLDPGLRLLTLPDPRQPIGNLAGRFGLRLGSSLFATGQPIGNLTLRRSLFLLGARRP